jgi:hypothetical protein
MKKMGLKFLLLIFPCFFAINAYGETPVINVIYPKGSGWIGAVDSTFIFGSVTPGS